MTNNRTIEREAKEHKEAERGASENKKRKEN